jgi:hypothetical protein
MEEYLIKGCMGSIDMLGVSGPLNLPASITSYDDEFEPVLMD